MKFSIGYQLPDERDSTEDICRDFAPHVSNVYFSLADDPSGRSPLVDPSDADGVEAVRQYQLEELRRIREMGISLTLLLNANCYGASAVSVELRDRTIEKVKILQERVGISRVTTTSPFLAEQLRRTFSDSLPIVASVNMRIGTVQAMAQLSGMFDGFYLQKEQNRNLETVQVLKEWCDAHGKRLYLLANSGCLAYCGFQTFHDNLVAHESELTQRENVSDGFPAPCWKYLHGLPQEDALTTFLQGSWIRPEEVRFYEPYVPEMKLATRMHSRPRMVLAAYVRGRFTGNGMDLTEPSYSPLFCGTILDSTRFPDDWGTHALHCTHNCEACGFCRRVAQQAAVSVF